MKPIVGKKLDNFEKNLMMSFYLDDHFTEKVEKYELTPELAALLTKRGLRPNKAKHNSSGNVKKILNGTVNPTMDK